MRQGEGRRACGGRFDLEQEELVCSEPHPMHNTCFGGDSKPQAISFGLSPDGPFLNGGNGGGGSSNY